jgi:redox-sensing transcriptional repressor
VPEESRVPEATVYRLSLYHCFLGEALRIGESDTRITSRQIAQELDIREETVRRDLSYIGGVGRPGAGYQPESLFRALQDFLGLKDQYPVIKVGSAQMLKALQVVFPAHAYGIEAVAYYSELPDDVGTIVDGIVVRHVSEIPELDPALEATVALVACSPAWIQRSLDLLHEAGISGVLLITPAIQLDIPEGMSLTHVRMPCDIKSLACRCQRPVER